MVDSILKAESFYITLTVHWENGWRVCLSCLLSWGPALLCPDPAVSAEKPLLGNDFLKLWWQVFLTGWGESSECTKLLALLSIMKKFWPSHSNKNKPVCVLIAPLLIQHPADGLGKAAEDSPSAWALPVSHLEDWKMLQVPSSWLCLSCCSHLGQQTWVWKTSHSISPSLCNFFK